MVTRLTNYTKQRYVRNSTDDPGDIVFRNGDTAFLMDLQQELIYSEENNQWYPVPSGGGGGGGGGGGITLLGSGTFTHGSSVGLTIPVSYSGNPYFSVVIASDPPDSTGQTVMDFRLFNPFVPGMSASDPSGFEYYTGINASNVYSAHCRSRGNLGNSTLTATTLTIARLDTTYVWPNGVTYNWYIYGEA